MWGCGGWGAVGAGGDGGGVAGRVGPRGGGGSGVPVPVAGVQVESQVAVTKTGEGIWQARGRRSCSRTRSPICSSRSWLKSGSQIVVPAQRRDLVRPIGEPSLQRHPHTPAGAGQPLLGR